MRKLLWEVHMHPHFLTIYLLKLQQIMLSLVKEKKLFGNFLMLFQLKKIFQILKDFHISGKVK